MQIFFSVFWWIYFLIFFTGYPLVYGFFHFMGRSKNMHEAIAQKIYPLLPVAYAFVTTGFWILILFTGKINFVIERIASGANSLVVLLYSVTGLLFWLPFFRKKPGLSFLHSLPLFLVPPLNLFVNIFQHRVIPEEYFSNMLRIYTAGFIIHLVAIILLLIIQRIFGRLLVHRI